MPSREGDHWRGIVWINGVKVRQKRFRYKRDAAKWETEEKDRLTRPITDTDFLTLYNRYLDYAKRFTDKTYQEKKSCLDRFKKFMGGNIPLSSITPAEAEAYLIQQSQTRSSNAANKDRKNLNSVWNWGIKILDLDKNPIAKTGKFAHDRKPQYTPPEKDVLAVLAGTKGQDRVFLQCYLTTAARRTEIMHLTWADVNFEKREVRLWTKKTKDGSMEASWLPMNNTLHGALWWQWNNRKFKDATHVFMDDQKGPHYGKPYEVRRRFLKGLCKRAGVKPFNFHALRRFVAQMLADKHKQSTQTVQRFLRHKHHRTTEVYLENINKDLRPAADFLNLTSPQHPQNDKEANGDNR